MKTVSGSTLQNRMNELFREIESTGEEIAVMEDEELVMKIISYRREPLANESNQTDSSPSY